MEFICQNEDCINKGVSVHVGVCNYKFVGGKLIADERFCTICKQEMEEIKDPEGWKHFIVGEQFGSVNKNWSKPVEKPLY